jgi:hypothetical protein
MAVFSEQIGTASIRVEGSDAACAQSLDQFHTLVAQEELRVIAEELNTMRLRRRALQKRQVVLRRVIENCAPDVVPPADVVE